MIAVSCLTTTCAGCIWWCSPPVRSPGRFDIGMVAGHTSTRSAPIRPSSLKQARDAAAKVLRAVAEGRHPEQRQSGSVEDAVAQFLERHGRNYRPKPRSEAERLLRLHVVGTWGRRKLQEITRADVRAMLARIDAPIAANRVHSITRRLFNWAVENDLIVSSPVAGLKAPNAETSRDRILTDDELRRVWQAAEGLGPLNGAVVRLLILTGQRRNEVAHMQWGRSSASRTASGRFRESE